MMRWRAGFLTGQAKSDSRVEAVAKRAGQTVGSALCRDIQIELGKDQRSAQPINIIGPLRTQQLVVAGPVGGLQALLPASKDSCVQLPE